MPLHVLAEDPLRRDLVDDARNVRPEVPRVCRSASLPRDAEGLAGITGSDEMNSAAPRSAVEGSKVVPDSRLAQGRVLHPGHESGRRVTFPLDETNSPISGLGDVKAEIETAIAGA